jgi:VanZ family protein
MKLKYISWLPAAILMVVIFLFSTKPAVNSNESSLFIARNVLSIYENVTDMDFTGAKRSKALENINHIVRKGAHFSEYALLACMFALHLIALRKKGKLLLLLPVGLSAIYASTDEFHQLFVAGRSGQITDVLIDTSGAAAGSLLFSFLVLLIVRYRRKDKKKLR